MVRCGRHTVQRRELEDAVLGNFSQEQHRSRRPIGLRKRLVCTYDRAEGEETVEVVPQMIMDLDKLAAVSCGSMIVLTNS